MLNPVPYRKTFLRFWTKGHPTPSNLEIIPLLDHIGPGSQDLVDVVAHEGKTQQVDRHKRTLEFQDFEDPVLAMGIMGLRCQISPKKKQIPNRFGNGMNDGDFVGFNQTTSSFTCHGNSPPDKQMN
jgi:hypothetical protein